MKVFQTYNKMTKSYVKMKTMKNGSVRIVNQKQKNPSKPFKGVPVRKRK